MSVFRCEHVAVAGEANMIISKSLRMAGWIGLVLGAFLLLIEPGAAQARGEENTVKGKHIALQWSLAPADPFSDENQAGKTTGLRRGSRVILTISGTPQPDWHTYPIRKATPSQDSSQLSTVQFNSEYLVPIGPVVESEPELVDEGEVLGKAYEYRGTFTWTQEFLIRPSAPAGQTTGLNAEVRTLVCEKTCVEDRLTLAVAVPVSTDAPLALGPDEEN
jgi:hypothetical protein